jgi:hypothetical protein
MFPCALRLTSIGAIVVAAAGVARGAEPGRLRFVAVGAQQGETVPCRIHLKDALGKPVRAPGLPFWFDHVSTPGRFELELAPGVYTYEVERGPEYALLSGRFEVQAAEAVEVKVTLDRIADMAAEGWFSGDLHVHRPVDEIEAIMRAEDLHVAPVITWWNRNNWWTDHPPPAVSLVRFDGDRFFDLMAGEDEREGGALLFFHLKRPLLISEATREYPSPLEFVAQARKQPGVWIDVEKPFWWDMPVWVAAGAVDSIGLANNHMARGGMYPGEAWGRPRDKDRLPPPLGNGYFTQEVYYHLLNCGLRIPPSAGSASGVLPNPVGYDRVYVYVGKELDYPGWWEALRQGHAFVTNGPLLRVTAGGQWPGHVFKSPEGRPLNLDLKARLTSREPIRAIEIIVNGHVERTVAPADLERTRSLGTLSFARSGWFLVRALTTNETTFRFASTAPFYVEIGSEPRRVSRESARYFLDWVRERAGRVKLDDPAQRESVLRYHRQAEAFWENLVSKANAD